MGHTGGHVLEAVHKLSHGRAVAHGLLFSFFLSSKKSLLPQSVCDSYSSLLHTKLKLETLEKISEEKFFSYLLKDKKKSKQGETKFLLLEKPGKVKNISLSYDEIIFAAREYGFVL